MIRARGVPLLAVAAALLVLWYTAAYVLNRPEAVALIDPAAPRGFSAVLAAAWSMDRPVLPTPDQIVASLAVSILGNPLGSPRNFLLQAGYTAEAALAGLGLGLVLGVALAIGIVHSRVMDRSLMPWIIASQTVPILAIAPMAIVALGNLGLAGLAPKAAIVGYLSFFPIVVGMVKGLRSPEPAQLDLLHTYDAGRGQVFRYLRWPVSLACLSPGLKVAAGLAVTGAIVAELPAGATVGLGARLLAGSYYGQVTMMWGALALASLLALCLIGGVRLVEVALRRRRGGCL